VAGSENSRAGTRLADGVHPTTAGGTALAALIVAKVVR
jgi:phospholipase/lecithinase/hemolysin